MITALNARPIQGQL